MKIVRFFYDKFIIPEILPSQAVGVTKKCKAAPSIDTRGALK